MLSFCLWELGHAFTDPGFAVQPGMHPRRGESRIVFVSLLLRVHPGIKTHYLPFQGNNRAVWRNDGLKLVLERRCDSNCTWLLQNVVREQNIVSLHLSMAASPSAFCQVSAHVAARGHPNVTAAGRAITKADQEMREALRLVLASNYTVHLS